MNLNMSLSTPRRPVLSSSELRGSAGEEGSAGEAGEAGEAGDSAA